MKAKSLADLGTLLESAVAPAFIQPVEKECDDLVGEISRIANDYKARSIDEFVMALINYNVPYDTVASVVNKLHIEGVFSKVNITVQGKNVDTFRLKPVILGTTRIIARPRKQREMDPIMKAPELGTVNKDEGLDVCIWKVMQDRKVRTPDEIAAILAAYGFERKPVKERVVSLMKQKTWFDRKERGGRDVAYILKKTCQMPQVPGFVPFVDIDKAVRPEGILTQQQQANLDNENAEREDFGLPYISPEEKAQDLAAQEQAPFQAPKIEKSDTLEVALWKAMCDHKPYSSGELIVLLGDTKFTKTEIYNMVGRKNLSGWFDVTKKNNSSRGQYYTLRAGVAMPFQPGQARPRVSIPEQTNLGNEPVHHSEVQKQPVGLGEVNYTTEHRGVIPVDTPALVEVVIRLKGQDFTRSELNTIESVFTRHLEEEQSRASVNSLVKRNSALEVRGVEFDLVEIQQIVHYLRRSK